MIGPPIFGAVASVSGLRVAFAMLAPASLAIIALGYRQRRKPAGTDAHRPVICLPAHDPDAAGRLVAGKGGGSC